MAKFIGAGKRLSILKNLSLEKNNKNSDDKDKLDKSHLFKIS